MKNIIKRIAAVALAGIAISACSDKEPNIDASRPIMLRTTGNETFLLTRLGKELDLSIYDGTKKFVSISEKFPSPITGFDVYKNKLVYVSKTALDAPSTIYICENFFEECSKLSELKGAVQSPILYEEGKRILFLYSDERNNKSNAPYVNFDFYSFDITTAKISRLTRYRFFPTSHIIAINDNEFAFSAIFINKNRLKIENRK